MSYVMIQNKGELPIWGLRLMGLSDKTADKIGRFGTGLKESLALLARLGLQPIIFSGELRMDIAVKMWDDQEELSFKLSETRGRFEGGIWYGLGIHPNLGKHDWDDEWMIFREILCNALDESGTEDLFHDICYHEPEGVAGATRFYIPAAKNIVEAYETIGDKLLSLGDYEVEQEVENRGRCIKNRKAKKLQVFHRGVWIQENKLESLWDYEVSNIKLSESRSADWWDINYEVAHLIAEFTEDQAKTLLYEIISLDHTGLYEATVLEKASQLVTSGTVAFKNAFIALFGDNAVLTDSSQFIYERLKALGKDPVIVAHSGLRRLLRSAEVPTADSILTPEQRRWEHISKPTGKSKQLLDKIWDMLVQANKTFGAKKPELACFSEELSKATVIHGAYVKGKVWINTACVGSLTERRAMIEECAHHISEAGDETREFQSFLLDLADHFMFEISCGSLEER